MLAWGAECLVFELVIRFSTKEMSGGDSGGGGG